MFNMLKKRIKNEKGLSLVELLAVIVILAIVAAIAIPAIGNVINNQRDKAILSEVSGLISASKIAFADGSCAKADATSGNVVCTYATTGTTNQVDFDSKKITAGTVTFVGGKAGSDDIKVTTHTLGTGVSFKGKNKTAFESLFSTSGGFTETALNTEMGN